MKRKIDRHGLPKSCSVAFQGPIALLLTLLIVTLSETASAWDGKRKGFVLGFGLGPGYVSSSDRSGTITSDKKSFALISNMKLGFAPTDLLQIHYMNKMVLEIFGSGVYGRTTRVTMINGIGGTRYLDKYAPSWFFSAAGGLSNEGGPGLILGVGYEELKHMSLEANVMWTRAGNSNFSAVSLDLTFNVLGY